MGEPRLLGGIEAGGTKFVCAVGSGNGELLLREEIKTTSPRETLAKVYEFFKYKSDIQALGIGSFGPLDLNPKSNTYGSILNTTKPGWNGINIPDFLVRNLKVPINIATDTDVAAIGEQYFGKAVGINNFAYLTVGTGIGGSLIVNAKLVHGISHPEIGHIRIPHNKIEDPTQGICEYHDDCLEGLASGQALKSRTGIKAEEVTDANIWKLEASYLAYGLVSIIATLQPECIILGGGVIKHDGLIEMIRQNVSDYVNNYFNLPKLDKYIVHSSSDTIGVLGAVKLSSFHNN